METKINRNCGSCIHQFACLWACGGAFANYSAQKEPCINYETMQDFVEKYAPLYGYTKVTDND